MNILKTIWKTQLPHFEKTEHAAAFFLLHDLILDRDPKKSGFTPVTNPVKLANGQRQWQGLEKASRDLYSMIKYHKNPIFEEMVKGGLDLDLIEQRRVASSVGTALSSK